MAQADALQVILPLGSRRYLRVKRLLDYVVCIPLLVAVLPLMLAVAAAIRISSPGPALFVQERDGFCGRKFRVLKFRTMHLDADARLAACLAEDPALAEEWTRCFKLRNDPRLIGLLGRFLRASSLDELPQLINVLRGDMTLIGPRPFPDYHLAALDPGFRRLRATVMPGLTGLWQTLRRDNCLETQIELDSYYIRNMSFRLDVLIIFKTLLVLVSFRNV
ncbi:MAG TPA: sugar transferase [Dongiaceae bacterium]|jgi:lipopolysaccharide/colanic/teichoic acid biosynthesis glycosyltransferase|nr:sugar transferase [Dongiaceae bacterium]